MSTIPPYIASLPLRGALDGDLRLAAGQFFRARVAEVENGSLKLDLGYATLEAAFQDEPPAVGDRVLIRIAEVGPNHLTLQLTQLPAGAATPVPVADAGALLASLGLPVDDPLLGVLRGLQATPEGAALPPQVLAALVLSFGKEANTLAPLIQQMLAARVGGRSMDAATLRGDAADTAATIRLLQDLITGDQPKQLKSLQQLQTPAAGGVQTPSSALALALSALSGHQVRVLYESLPDGSLLIEEQPRRNHDEPSTYRFLARVDLPSLGPVGVQCLYAAASCIARVTAAPSTHALLAPLLEEAS
ncbi:MAG: hypothetical protein ABI743_10525, partial [bacterium]